MEGFVEQITRDCFGLRPRNDSAMGEMEGKKGAAQPPPFFPLPLQRGVVIARVYPEAISVAKVVL